MMINTYQEGLVKQGDEAIAVLKKNDVTYRLPPVEQFQEVIFYNLDAETPVTYNLADFIDCNYHILGYEIDLKVDDELSSDQSTIGSSDYGLILETRRIVDGKPKSRIHYGIGSGRLQFGYSFLRPDEQLRLTVSADCNSVTFICVPCALSKPINITTFS